MTAPIVVVGGGLAAGTLVTQLREHGHDGEVVVLAEETHAPYERPPLSKDLLLDKGTPDDAAVHEHGVVRRPRHRPADRHGRHRARRGGPPRAGRRRVARLRRARARHRGAAAPPADGRRVRRTGRLPAHPRRLPRPARAPHRGRPRRHHRRRLDRARGRVGRPAARRRGHRPRVSRPPPAARARAGGGAGLRRPPPRARGRPPHRRPGHGRHLARRRRDGRPR